MDISDKNPLLQDFVFPPYDVVRPDHICPGISSLLQQLEKDLTVLENSVEPTWQKLVVPLEKITDRLSVVWGIVNHLNSVKDSPQLRAAIEEIQPKKVEFELRLKQSKPIFEAFKEIKDSSVWDELNDARKRVVDMKLKESALIGIHLDDRKRRRFNEIEQELEKLGQVFEEHILDATKNFKKLIEDRTEIRGLPQTAVNIAAENAVVEGYEDATPENGPWVITLDGPIYRSVLQHVHDRSLREEVFRAYVARASYGTLNNTPIIERILELRSEKAALLGFPNYAEVSFESKMATIDKAKDLIEKLHDASWAPAVRDMEDIKRFAREQGAEEEAEDLNHWDINFWSERLRESKYGLNEEELRAYFPLPKVMDGLFDLTKKLFGISVEPADGIAPVWNKDAKLYGVKDMRSNSTVAYFYFDPYSRPSEKRGGAWMESVVGRSSVFPSRLPIALVVCNQAPPTSHGPSLMTVREVETVFHEFGHALQHVLSEQDEGLVSGTKGIEWDAVEIASQFMENWFYQRDTIVEIAEHYETGENIPDDLCSRILAARTFRAGSLLLRQLRYAGVDLELHTTYEPFGRKESVHDVDQRIGKKTHVIPLIPEDRFLCSFSHIFADKYAAGYYSYQWAEVLSADAFSAFEEAGLDNDERVRERGAKFRETILALGGGKSPNEIFMDFRGREPTPNAFLRYNGLLQYEIV